MTKEEQKQNLSGLVILLIILIAGSINIGIMLDVERNVNENLREKIIDLEVENLQLKELVCGEKKSFMSRTNEINKEKSYYFSNGWISEKDLSTLCLK